MKREGVALGLTLLLAACATNTAGVMLSGQAGGGATFVSQNSSLHVTLSEQSRREQNGLLQINLILGNTQSGDSQLQYRVSWYDVGGNEVGGDGSNWIPIQLHGYQSRTLSALAPTPAARGYKIDVRAVTEESY